MRAALARQADAQRATQMRCPLPPLLLALAAGLPAQDDQAHPLRLHDHGRGKAPELTAAQKGWLGW